MSGAMAGTAILECPPVSRALYAVGLTINNICNLACSHCYLQYLSSHTYISNWLIDLVLDTQFELCCVVGMEPLANSKSIDLVGRLAEANTAAGRRTSIITNGKNLSKLSNELIRRLAWIDVSLDAGVSEYLEIRGQSPEFIISGAHHVNSVRAGLIRALFTIHSDNVEHINEMLEFAAKIGASTLLFSPYQKTESDGTQSASMVSPEHYMLSLQHLLSSIRRSVYITLDIKYLEKALGSRAAVQFARAAHLRYAKYPNFVLTEKDPITRGIMRITHDGIALRPFESIDTMHYKATGIKVRDRSLASIFGELSDSFGASANCSS